MVATRLFEHESKAILRGYGIAVPEGVVLDRASFHASLKKLMLPCILKAQVPVGGRGKAGGVLKVYDLEEAERQAQRILSMNIGGFPVASVLAEEVVEGVKEYYLSALVDRGNRCHALVAGAEGGMDVEKAARENPGSILSLRIQPLEGVSDRDVELIASHFEVTKEKIAPVVRALYACFLEEDAELLEVNPLVVTTKGLVALDAKMSIDDNALFRHPQLRLLPPRGKSTEEMEAEQAGLNFVSLDGDIGVIGNGAGLTMATMDLLKGKGGSAANFLDLGAGAKAERVESAIRFLQRDGRVKGVLVNIYGGMTRCDEVAKGIAAAAEPQSQKPVVVRLVGTNQELGEAILAAAGIVYFKDPSMAAERIVALVGGAP